MARKPENLDPYARAAAQHPVVHGPKVYSAEMHEAQYPKAPRKPGYWTEPASITTARTRVALTLLGVTVGIAGLYAAYEGNTGPIGHPIKVAGPSENLAKPPIEGNVPSKKNTPVDIAIGNIITARVCDGSYRDILSGYTTVNPIVVDKDDAGPERLARYDNITDSNATPAVRLSVDAPLASMDNRGEWRNSANERLDKEPLCYTVPLKLVKPDLNSAPYFVVDANSGPLPPAMAPNEVVNRIY